MKGTEESIDNYHESNRVCCWRLSVFVTRRVTLACFVGGPKKLIAAACCSLSVMRLFWVATGLFLGGIVMNEPSVIRKAYI